MGEIFMELVFFSITIMVLFFIFIVYITKTTWRATTTIDEYKKNNPDCVTDKGMKCKICNSESITSIGYGSVFATERISICNHCGTRLYRTN